MGIIKNALSLNIYILLILGCFFSSCSQCNSGNLSPQQLAKEKAVMVNEIEMMGNSLIEKDYDLFYEYNIPLIMESIGGKRKMLEYLLMMEESFEESGSKIKKIEVIDVPILVKKNGELQSIIEQELIIKTKEDTEKITGQKMLGVTSKNGRKWQFMDVSKKKFEEVKILIPDLDSRLEKYF